MLAFPYRVLILVVVALAAAVWLFMQPPIPQSQRYHCFADQRPFLGVPHFLNVVSNVPFAIVGAAGMCFLWSTSAWRRGGPVEDATVRAAYGAFFFGVFWTAFGSTYYHLDPDNRRLMWDRLPMSVAFMGLFAAIIAERIDLRAGKVLLLPLLAAGVWSVLYWRETDDLRPYYYVQFFPLAALPLILVLFPPAYTRTGDLILALGWYVAAKFCETPLDATIYHAGHVVSGHTLKHLGAAMGAFQLLLMIRRREGLR
jgi:hypothetical protein